MFLEASRNSPGAPHRFLSHEQGPASWGGRRPCTQACGVWKRPGERQEVIQHSLLLAPARRCSELGLGDSPHQCLPLPVRLSPSKWGSGSTFKTCRWCSPAGEPPGGSEPATARFSSFLMGSEFSFRGPPSSPPPQGTGRLFPGGPPTSVSLTTRFWSCQASSWTRGFAVRS